MRGHFLQIFLICAVSFGLVSCQSESAPPSPTPVAVQGAPIDSAPAQPVGPGGVRQAPTDPEERAALAVDVPAPTGREGYFSLGFTKLSDFEYNTDELGRLESGSKVPSEISSLDGKKVAVSGFMVPIEFQEDKVSAFILVRNQLLCCYGEEPKLNEWMLVEISPPVEMITEVPVTLFGDFEVGPDMEEDMVVSLYRLKADVMEKAG